MWDVETSTSAPWLKTWTPASCGSAGMKAAWPETDEPPFQICGPEATDDRTEVHEHFAEPSPGSGAGHRMPQPEVETGAADTTQYATARRPAAEARAWDR